LTWLEHLDLQNNHITKLPPWIGELRQLNHLILWANPLQALPRALTNLQRLRQLVILNPLNSQVAGLRFIAPLKNLEVLVLCDIELRTFPNWLLNLSNLEFLYLFGNRLKSVPSGIANLRKLKRLELNNNRLEDLPASLLGLTNLRELRLDNNLLPIPSEIVSSHDASKILGYYFRTRDEGTAQPLNEFKLILVGRGGVGKTTLVHRLITDRYKEFKRTPGINITKWPVQIENNEVRAHVWDFGGQEIMHGTHRFFMTERALYLVLLSGREGTEDHDAEYWLSLVRSFAGNVPIIILLNKWDDYTFELNRQLLRDKYGAKLAFVETDSFTGTGMPELREKICQMAKRLPGLKAAWPNEWRQIKDDLPRQKRSWLTFEDFRTFCDKHGITKPRDQEDLADSFHDLGLMLSYRKDETLRDFGVLNPQWITKGIYAVLNSPLLKKAQGRFTANTFTEVLPDRTYPKSLHSFLLALMRKFQLCHPLDDKGEKYLIPELLTKEEPELDSDFPAEKCLGFIYQYDSVLPEGLLPRFIVETYFLREPKYVWRTGAVLERAKTRALVRGDVQGRKVSIRVAGGKGRRELLGIIREHFERIHRTYEKLPVTELVPVPKHPDVTISYGELLDYEVAGDDEYKVVIDGSVIKLSVTTLLDGVDAPGTRGVIRQTPTFRAMPQEGALSLFISYSHTDETFRDQLRGALMAYERKGELVPWDDTKIIPGQKWESEILENLERADIIVLLLSNDFISSDYCYQKEFERARERDAAGECVIVPIVVRACPFQKLELGKIQAIQPKGKPIKSATDRDAAWLEVTKQMDRVIARLNKARVH